MKYNNHLLHSHHCLVYIAIFVFSESLFSFFNVLFYIGVQLVSNVMIAYVYSEVIQLYLYLFIFKFFSCVCPYRVFSRNFCAIE